MEPTEAVPPELEAWAAPHAGAEQLWEAVGEADEGEDDVAVGAYAIGSVAAAADDTDENEYVSMQVEQESADEDEESDEEEDEDESEED